MKTTEVTLLAEIEEQCLDLCAAWQARSVAQNDFLAQDMSKFFFLMTEFFIRMKEDEQNEN